MAHIRALAEVAPAAGAWLHLGATSCYVTDNADLIILRRALDGCCIERAAGVVAALAAFAERHARPAPASATPTSSRRSPRPSASAPACGSQDLLADLERLEVEAGRLLLRGAKGATGTQASFLQLLGEPRQGARARPPHRHGVRLRRQSTRSPARPRRASPSSTCWPASRGSRQSATKFATDVRLLSRLKELDEPFERHAGRLLGHAVQAQPDALASASARWRATSSRLEPNAAWTAAGAVARAHPRRLGQPPARAPGGVPRRRRAAPAVWQSVASGLEVYPAMVRRNLDEELPFMATRGDPAGRRGVRRRPPAPARAAARAVAGGRPAASRSTASPTRSSTWWPATRPSGSRPRASAGCWSPARFVGRAPEQVDEFLAGWVEPWLAGHPAGCRR